MKGIVTVAIVVFLSLLTVSCASAPHWSGTETETGEFILTQSPGIRFYFNVLILAALIVLITVALFKKPQKEEDKFGLDHLGCLGLIVLFFIFLLWTQIKQNIRTETITINQDRLMKTHYPDNLLKNDVLEWKNVASCGYFSGEFDVVKSRMVVGGTHWKTGDNLRGITLTDQNKKQLTLIIEKDEFDTHWMSYFKEWIFGSNDFAFSPADEARLKSAINKYLPEEVKQKMPPETKEYFKKQE